MNKTVKTALENKVDQFEYHKPFNIRREIRLFVNESDKSARRYCEEMCSQLGMQVSPGIVAGSEDLEQMMGQLCDRADESDNPVKHRQYILFVVSDLQMIVNIDFEEYRESFQEYEYELLLLSRKVRDLKRLSGFMRCMMISPTDILSGKFLVIDAAVSPHRLSPKDLGFGEGHSWYRLRTKDFNAAREEICEQLYAGIRPQLEGEVPGEVIAKLRGIEEKIFLPWIRNLCFDRRNYPLASELPLVGYGELCNYLMNRIPQKNSLLGGGGQQKYPTGFFAGVVLGILFGKEKDNPRTEMLRRALGEEAISRLCRKTISENQAPFAGLLFNNFTLQDLYAPSGIASRASSRMEEYHIQSDQMEDWFRDYLSRAEFYTVSLEIKDLMEGLQTYFVQWNKYIEICFWKEWWGGISELVNTLSKRDSQEFACLSEICDDVKEKIDFKNVQMNRQTPIRRVNEVLNLIQGFSRACTYTVQDLHSLRERESSQILAAHGDSGDIRLRPHMCMLVNDQVVQRKQTERTGNLDWLILPVSFVSESMTYVLRMYAVLEEQVQE